MEAAGFKKKYTWNNGDGSAVQQCCAKVDKWTAFQNLTYFLHECSRDISQSVWLLVTTAFR